MQSYLNGITVTLDFPFKHNGKTINKLTMRGATPQESVRLALVEATRDIKGEAKLVARLCGLSKAALAKMDYIDYINMLSAYAAANGYPVK